MCRGLQSVYRSEKYIFHREESSNLWFVQSLGFIGFTRLLIYFSVECDSKLFAYFWLSISKKIKRKGSWGS